MRGKSLPVKMLKKGEVFQQKPIEQPIIERAVPAVKKPQDFRQYLNLYNFQCELPGCGETIEFKPLTVAHLKKLQTLDPGKDAEKKKDDPVFLSKVFDRIFEEVIVSEIDLDEMYVNDRFALILEIRKKTSGEKYQWTLSCPKCKSQSTQIINFDDIEIKLPPKELEHKIKLTDQLSITVDYIKRSDEKEIHAYYEDIHKNDEDINVPQRQSDIASLMIAASIKTIITPEGEYEPTLEDKIFFTENIPSILYAEISKWQSNNFFGPNFEINIKCPHCDFKASQEISSSDFFS